MPRYKPLTPSAGQPTLVFSAGTFQGFSTPLTANVSSQAAGGKRPAEGDPARQEEDAAEQEDAAQASPPGTHNQG